MSTARPFDAPEVAQHFESYPSAARRRLLALRELIFDTAAATLGVGALTETLKWGEPAYLTRRGVGTTVRIDWKPKDPDQYALYVHCQTTLIESFRLRFPNDFRFEGNRALVLDLDAEPPVDALRQCIAAALTYHRARRGRAGAPRG